MNIEKKFTGSTLPASSWLEVLNPSVCLGHIRHAVFDFDGTLSVIRCGWEKVMIPLMIEAICGDHAPDADIAAEVCEYVDRSTGILTIKQMKWLEAAVCHYGLNEHVLTARQYKKEYNERILTPVRERMEQLDGSQASQDAFMMAGSRAFLKGLDDRGVSLYLVSGTDHIYVMEEAAALGVVEFFDGRIYGAQDDNELNSKEQIIQRILEDNHLQGEELLVVGDGPVEIRLAKEWKAIALGVASNEEERQGLNPRKRQRLLGAGADLIVTDYLHHEELVNLLHE